LNTAKSHNIPIDDPSIETAHLPLLKDRRIPVYAEGPTLQELKAGLDHGSCKNQGDDAIEEDFPTASVLDVQEKEGDAEFDESDGPVPEDLANED
jgi:hypothetical protein